MSHTVTHVIKLTTTASAPEVWNLFLPPQNEASTPPRPTSPPDKPLESTTSEPSTFPQTGDRYLSLIKSDVQDRQGIKSYEIHKKPKGTYPTQPGEALEAQRKAFIDQLWSLERRENILPHGTLYSATQMGFLSFYPLPFITQLMINFSLSIRPGRRGLNDHREAQLTYDAKNHLTFKVSETVKELLNIGQRLPEQKPPENPEDPEDLEQTEDLEGPNENPNFSLSLDCLFKAAFTPSSEHRPVGKATMTSTLTLKMQENDFNGHLVLLFLSNPAFLYRRLPGDSPENFSRRTSSHLNKKLLCHDAETTRDQLPLEDFQLMESIFRCFWHSTKKTPKRRKAMLNEMIQAWSHPREKFPALYVKALNHLNQQGRTLLHNAYAAAQATGASQFPEDVLACYGIQQTKRNKAREKTKKYVKIFTFILGVGVVVTAAVLFPPLFAAIAAIALVGVMLTEQQVMRMIPRLPTRPAVLFARAPKGSSIENSSRRSPPTHEAPALEAIPV